MGIEKDLSENRFRKWFSTKEERAAFVGGLIPGITAIILAVTAFFVGASGKEEVLLAMSKQHVEELYRQQELLGKAHAQKEVELNLEVWRKSAEDNIKAINAIGLSAKKELKLSTLQDVLNHIEHLENVFLIRSEIERGFDDTNFLRFVRDNAGSNANKYFSQFMNEKGRVNNEIQGLLLGKPKHSTYEDAIKFDKELLLLTNRGLHTATGYFGTILYSSIKSLSFLPNKLSKNELDSIRNYSPNNVFE